MKKHCAKLEYPPELADAARFIVDKIDKGADL